MYLPVSRDSIEVATDNLTIDIQLENAYTLVLIDYNVDGSLKTFPEFSNNVWAIDEFGAPSEGHRVKIQDAEYSTSTLGLIVPLSSSMISIMAQTSSPSIQGFVVSADNSGKGYGSTEQGGVIIYLNKETANTAMTRVNEKNARGNYLPIATTTVEQNQNRAFTFQMSNPDVVQLSQDIIDDNTRAEDDLEAARAEKYSKNFRNSNVTVRLSDASGNAPEGVSLTLDMSSRDYNFGVYASPFNYNETAAWTMLKDIGINTATVDFWWSPISSTTSRVEQEDTLREKIGKLISMGFKLRATGLFQPTSSVLPLYVKAGNVEEFAEALRGHVTSLVSTYCQQFDMIEVSTDLNDLGARLGFNSSEIVYLQRVSLAAIQKAAPGVRTSISTSNEYTPLENSWNVPLPYYQFSRQWITAGLSVDQIGQEIYHGASSPAHTVGDLSDLLDAVSTLGRPVRVSRFNVPVAVEDKGKYLEKFYAVAFAKKNVKEITFGDIISDGATVGLFDSDMSPTHLFYSLKNTIARLTSGTPMSVVDGQITTSRVAGDYTLSAKRNGQTISSIRMRLEEGRKNKVSVVYNEAENSATFQLDSPTSPVVNNPAPAPAPKPMADSQNQPDNSSAPLAGWAIFLIAFTTIVFVASLVAFVVFAAIRRRNNSSSTTSIDLANGTDKPDTGIATVTLDDSPTSPAVSPEKWTEGPLCIEVPLDNASEQEDDEEHTDTDMTSSESEEEVPLDEEEGMTSSGSDEEHL